MAGITSRYMSDRHRTKRRRESLRYWLAVGLGVLAVAGALIVFTRDVAWQSRNRDAALLAKTAEANGRFELARTFYQEALTNNPYDYETHLALADILNHRLNDPEGALRHYLYSLAYSPAIGGNDAIKREVTILTLIRSGELENPLDAIEEMFLCIEGNAKTAFMRRLEIRHRASGDAYWEGWKKRGRGKVIGVNISSNHEGFYDAAIELQYPDDTTMLLHLLCPLRDIWRLDLSFP